MAGTPESCESLNALKIAELEKRVNMQASYTERAVEVASRQLSIRLDHSNGLIAMLKEQTHTFVTREETRIALNSQDKRLTLIERLVWIAVGAIALFELAMKMFAHT